MKTLNKTTRTSMTCGCRVNYVPRLSKEIAGIYNDYIEKFNADLFTDKTASAGNNEKYLQRTTKLTECPVRV